MNAEVAEEDTEVAEGWEDEIAEPAEEEEGGETGAAVPIDSTSPESP